VTTVAGIDIGFTRKSPLAFALLELGGNSPVLVHHALFYPPKGVKGWEAVIDGIGVELMRCFSIWGIEEHAVDLLAYELPHVGSFKNEQGGQSTNAQTAIKLAHLCGIVRCIAAICGVPVVGVQPTQAKVALTGNGAAKKGDMVRMAKLMFGEELSEHEADAVGVALAGAALANFANFH
jgi:hypothetical protein